MSAINPRDIEIIATLGRLGLSDAELKHAASDVTNVLGHFSRLQAIATDNVPVSATMAGLTNVTRADEVEAEVLCSVDDLLSRAEVASDRLVKTPSVRA